MPQHTVCKNTPFRIAHDVTSCTSFSPFFVHNGAKKNIDAAFLHLHSITFEFLWITCENAGA